MSADHWSATPPGGGDTRDVFDLTAAELGDLVMEALDQQGVSVRLTTFLGNAVRVAVEGEEAEVWRRMKRGAWR